MDGKFQDFAGCDARGKFGGVIRGAQTSLKLQIADGRKRSRSEDGGAAGVCFWFLSYGRGGLRAGS